MKVSVCIPAYNVEKYIGHFIHSVLAQTFTDWEMVIVDDGSTDGTKGVVAGFNDARIRLIEHAKNEGIGAAQNACLQNAVGDYMTICGADDAFHTEYLAEMVKALETADFATCWIRVMDEHGKEILPDEKSHLALPKPKNGDDWKKRFFHAGNSNFGAVMFNRAKLISAGGFDDSFRQLLDLECYIRMIDHGFKLAVVERELFWYRVRPGQYSEPTPENYNHHVRQLDRIRQKHYFKPGTKQKIMIATPFYENKGYSPYIRSMFQTVYTLARHTVLEFDFQEVSGGSYIDHNRNMMASTFLDSDCTHLMFIDSDQSWDVQGFLNILKADKDIVGAAYPVKNNWENYGVTIHCDEQNRPIVDETGLIKADKVPTGFMKIHRSVFEKLRAANPDDWYWHGQDQRLYNYFGHLTIDHVRYGEDISFGIRWQRIGGEVWLEPRVSMGHYGSHGWYGNYHEFLLKQPGGSDAPILN